MSDPLIECISFLADGNFGALNALHDVYVNYPTMMAGVLEKLMKNNISGEKIWIMYNDEHKQHALAFANAVFLLP